MLQVRTDQARVGIKGRAVEACGLDDHALLEQGPGEEQVRQGIAAVEFQRGGKQADGFARLGFREDACGEGKVEVGGRDMP